MGKLQKKKIFKTTLKSANPNTGIFRDKYK